MSEDARFALNSGERQVSQTLAGIRRDHKARYELMIQAVRRNRKQPRCGGDIFSGTGYGTSLLAAELGCPMVGIDASAEAVRFAELNYSCPSTFYCAKVFPFALPPEVFDFVCLLESVEHVSDGQELIDTVVSALRPGGMLLMSTPNRERFDLAKNPNPFHFRHYAPSEALDMLRALDVLDCWGQNVYAMDGAGVITAILPEAEHEPKAGPDGQFMICLARKKERRRWLGLR